MNSLIVYIDFNENKYLCRHWSPPPLPLIGITDPSISDIVYIRPHETKKWQYRTSFSNYPYIFLEWTARGLNVCNCVWSHRLLCVIVCDPTACCV